MVRVAGPERLDPVELLQQDDACQVVGQREPREPERAVGRPPQLFSVTVRPSDEEGDAAHASVLERADFVGELAGR